MNENWNTLKFSGQYFTWKNFILKNIIIKSCMKIGGVWGRGGGRRGEKGIEEIREGGNF